MGEVSSQGLERSGEERIRLPGWSPQESGGPTGPSGRSGRAATRSLIIRAQLSWHTRAIVLAPIHLRVLRSLAPWGQLNSHGAASSRFATRPLLRTRPGHPGPHKIPGDTKTRVAELLRCRGSRFVPARFGG